MKTVIRNGKVIDPANRVNRVCDLVIDGAKIGGLIETGATPKTKKSEKFKEIDAAGCIVTPGFIDLHVHLREPGFEHKETICTGTAAAVAGGFTSVACMANTEPVNDNEAITGYILLKARDEGICRVFPVGAVTMGLKGESLSEMGSLKQAGVVAFSDDGNCIASSQVALRAFQYAAMFDMPISIHAEDLALTGSGVMNAGEVAMELGLPGRPAAAEEVMISRDLILAKSAGARLHIQHISTAGAVEMVRQAKTKGAKVTAEATPHHFTLTEENVGDYDTNYKMAPPLRSEKDRDAIIAGLADGAIDCIATDHAPHEHLMKDCEFDKAANGIIGLETALPLTLKLVREKRISLKRAVELLTRGPSRVFGLPGGTLAEGAEADVTVFDPSARWVYSLESIRSRSRNTPWLDAKMQGRVIFTIVGGKVVYKG